jgi:cardiolipin synthase
MPDSSTNDSNSIDSISNIKTEIERILGLPFSPNNYVKHLESGQLTFQTILEAVSNAKTVICIEFYLFKDDETGKKLAEILKEKAAQGVQVYLLYDHFGSFLTSHKFWTDLKTVGIKVHVSHPFKWTSPKGYIYRNHKKLLIIDGLKVFIGGFNIADEYHGYVRKKKNRWRDTGIYIEGPIASTMLEIFRKSWSKWKGNFVSCDITHQNINHGAQVIPVFANSGKARRKMRRLFVFSINNAKESILITTAYFFPSRRLLRALENSARRGIDVKLLLPGESDVMSVLYAGQAYYKRLLRAGVTIYNYQGSILHSKTAVFDDKWSIVGSANLDMQSLRRNEESNVGILDRDFGRQMSEAFKRDLKDANKIDLSKWMTRPLYHKFLENIFAAIMKRLCEPVNKNSTTGWNK